MSATLAGYSSCLSDTATPSGQSGRQAMTYISGQSGRQATTYTILSGQSGHQATTPIDFPDHPTSLLDLNSATTRGYNRSAGRHDYYHNLLNCTHQRNYQFVLHLHC